MLTQVGAQDAAAKVRFSWVFAVASVGPFMAALDNLMVTTALPMIMKPPARQPARGAAGWSTRTASRLRGSAMIKSLPLVLWRPAGAAAARLVLAAAGRGWPGGQRARLGDVSLSASDCLSGICAAAAEGSGPARLARAVVLCLVRGALRPRAAMPVTVPGGRVRVTMPWVSWMVVDFLEIFRMGARCRSGFVGTGRYGGLRK